MIIRDIEHSINLFKQLNTIEMFAKIGYAIHCEVSNNSIKTANCEALMTLTNYKSSHHSKQIKTASQLTKALTWNNSYKHSLLGMVNEARQNARVLQAHLGKDMWQVINKMHHWLLRPKAICVYKKSPQNFYQLIVQQCQLLHGMLAQNAIQDSSYYCYVLGTYSDRMWQTLKILNNSSQQKTVDHHEYLSLLRAFSVEEAFMKANHLQVNQDTVHGFLLHYPAHTATVSYCANKIVECLEKIKVIATPGENNALVQTNKIILALEKANQCKNNTDSKATLNELTTQTKSLTESLHKNFATLAHANNNKQTRRNTRHEFTV